jgi:uncharacterized protein YsxB (DUF464 family)
MIEIKFYEHLTRYSITVKGHDELAPRGQNIVCAAVSALVQCYSNYIAEHADDIPIRVLENKTDEGDANIDVDNYERDYGFPDLYYMIKEGLIDIAESCPGRVKIL